MVVGRGRARGRGGGRGRDRARGRGGGGRPPWLAPARAAQPLPEHRRADADDEQPRGERQPRVELSGTMNCESASVTSPRAKTPAVCVDRHGRAEQERVPRLALRADEVAGDERLAVPRREGVDGAPEGGDQEREQDHAEREVAALDRATRSPPLRCSGAGATADRWAPAPPSSRACTSTVALRDVERRAEQALRVGAELVRAARRGRGARRRRARRSRAVTTISLQPIRFP